MYVQLEMERKNVLLTFGALVAGLATVYLGYQAYECLWMIDGKCGDTNNKSETKNSFAGEPGTQADKVNEPTPGPIYTGQYLVDPQTQTRFDIVTVNNTPCIRLREFTSTDWQDVYRATKNLGPSQENYNDLSHTYVYDPNLIFLGTFHTNGTTDKKFKIVPIGTYICEKPIVQVPMTATP